MNSPELLILLPHQRVPPAQLLSQLAVSQFQSVDGFPLFQHLLRDLEFFLLQLLLEIRQILRYVEQDAVLLRYHLQLSYCGFNHPEIKYYFVELD